MDCIGSASVLFKKKELVLCDGGLSSVADRSHFACMTHRNVTLPVSIFLSHSRKVIDKLRNYSEFTPDP